MVSKFRESNLPIALRVCRWAVQSDGRNEGLNLVSATIVWVVWGAVALTINIQLEGWKVFQMLTGSIEVSDLTHVNEVGFVFLLISVLGSALVAFVYHAEDYHDDRIPAVRFEKGRWWRIRHLADVAAYELLVGPHARELLRTFGITKLAQARLDHQATFWGRAPHPLEWTRGPEVIEAANRVLRKHRFIALALAEQGQPVSQQLLTAKEDFWRMWWLAQALGIPTLKVNQYIWLTRAAGHFNFEPCEGRVNGDFTPEDWSAHWQSRVWSRFDHLCDSWANALGKQSVDLAGLQAADLALWVMVAKGIDLRTTKLGQRDDNLPLIEQVEGTAAELARIHRGMRDLDRKAYDAMDLGGVYRRPILQLVAPLRGGQAMSTIRYMYSSSSPARLSYGTPTTLNDSGIEDPNERTAALYRSDSPHWLALSDGSWIVSRDIFAIVAEVLGVDTAVACFGPNAGSVRVSTRRGG